MCVQGSSIKYESLPGVYQKQNSFRVLLRTVCVE